LSATGGIHYAKLENSPRLQRVLKVLSDGLEHSTREIQRLADVCAVGTCMDELRENGINVSPAKAKRIGDKTYYFYRLIKKTLFD
jgi:hypothetical protein